MRVSGEAVSEAVGPCKVDVASELKKSDVKEGQTIFIRTD
jgi:hypothetical protein